MSALDPLEMLAALGRMEPAEVRVVSGGADAAIWRVEQAGETFALRALRPDQAVQAARETRAMTAASAAGTPVPAVVASTTWRGRPVMLLEWVPGRTIAELLLAETANIESVRALGFAFGSALAAIHTVLPPPGLPSDWLRWPVNHPVLREHFAGVALNEPRLLHLDFHVLNVLALDGRVTGVLDWANAHFGDPRADLARALSIMQLTPIPDGIDPVVAKRALDDFETGWRRGYERAGGSFAGLAPFCWWAGLAMEHDLAPRLGRPGLPWLTPAFLERVRRWTADWKSVATAQPDPSS